MADLSFASLVEGKPVKLEKDGKTICVARVGNEVFAVDDTCSHSDASLSEGDVSQFKIRRKNFIQLSMGIFKKEVEVNNF